MSLGPAEAPVPVMSNASAAGATARIAVFDLDGTLTWRDTLLPFLGGYLARHPWRWPRLWRLPFAVAAFVLRQRDPGVFKSRLIRIVMGGEPRGAIDAWAAAFVGRLPARRAFRPAALRAIEEHRDAGDHLILLSASPDLYVPRIGRLLRFDLSISTEVLWCGDRLDGTLVSANRRGEEKVRCLESLHARYPGIPIVAYGNSASDIPLLRRADRAVLVNAHAAARKIARSAGIALADWR